MADAKLVPERRINLHSLNEDTPCPSCGQPSLVYVSARQGGDIYRCALERGGCERTVKHRKRRDSGACGIVLVTHGADLWPLRAMCEAPLEWGAPGTELGANRRY